MDLQKFLNASFQHREKSIDVPELADFFGKEKPVWIVRGLSGAELGRAKESSSNREATVKALISAMAGDGDKAVELRKAMGLSEDEVPQDISYRIEVLTAGSVSPELGQDNRDAAVKLCESYPTVFYNLTNTILNLTGQGSELGKRKPSGKTAA